VEGHGSITTFGKEEVASLAKGIVSTLKYYYEKDLNSFNFSIYSILANPITNFSSENHLQNSYSTLLP